MRDMLFGRTRLLLAGALVALGLGACSAPPPDFKPVAVTSFQVAPNPVAAGGDVTLTWQVAGDVDHLQLLKGSETLASPTDLAGSLKVEKLQAGTATFSIVVTGKGGDEARQTAEVNAVTKPTVGKFAADKTQVAAGSAVVLSWATALADKVEVTANGESLGGKQGADAAQGALLVKPDATTEYTLTATGIGGTDRAKVTVTVLPAPAFSTLEVTPQKVKAGEQATLHWVTSGATGLTVKVGGRAVYTAESDKVGEGTKVFTPDAPTTFQVAIAGPGGETTKDVSVSVVQVARVVSFRAEPPDAIVGSDITLSWEVVGVDSVELKANGEPVDLQGHGSALDSIVLQPQATTLYELSGQGEGGQAAGTLTVNVYGVPTIDQFTSDRATVFRRREAAVLSWQTRNGAQISIADSAGNIVDTGTQPAAQGSIPVNPTDSTDYTLTLVGPGGVLQSAPVHIDVQEPAPNVTLATSKTQILEGEQTVLSWEITDQSTFTLTANDQAIDVSNKQAKDVLSVSPTDTTVYTLSAVGPGGQAQKQVTVSVVKQPKFKVFTTNKIDQNNNTVVTKGSKYTVTWETTDATGTSFDPPRTSEIDSDPFVSIAGLPGTQAVTMSSSTDSGVGTITFPQGFLFPFFSGVYGSALVNTDGYLSFGSTATSSTFTNQQLPSSTTPNNLIAAFWDDLESDASSQFLWRIDGAAPNRKLTVEWKNLEFYAASSDNMNLNFQVVLFETGDWEIRNAPRAAPAANASSNTRFGSSATIGIENADGSAGFLISYNDANAAALCTSFTAGNSTTGAAPVCTTPLTRVRPGRLPASGSLELTAAADDILRMRAYGPLGSTKSNDLVIKAVEAPVAKTLTGSRNNIGLGEPFSLDWSVEPTTTGAARVITRVSLTDGKNRLFDNLNPTVFSGTASANPTTDTTYTLEAYNAAGDVATKSVSVHVGAPTATLTATGNKTSVPKGDQVELSWTTTGANTVTLKNPDGTVASGPFVFAADPTKVRANTVKVTPAASGTYVLEAVNGSGTTTAQIDVTVLTDLQIATLTVSQTEQTAKRNVTLAWEVYNGTSITVNVQGETTPLAGFPITDAAKIRSFSQAVPVRSTDTTYVMTATGADGSTVTRSVTVTSVPEPSVTAFTASPASVNWGESTTLSWTSTGATKLSLYELVGSGASATLGSEVIAARNQLNGSVQLSLFKPTGYRLVVENRLGASSQVSKDLDPQVTVNVTQPTINLSLTPADGVPRGGYATLGWTATQAERVYLFGSDVQYVPNGFVDISATGTEVVMKSSGTGTNNWDTGYLNFALPADFSPLFFGEAMTKIGITADGVVGLASGSNNPYCGYTSSCSSVGTLPSTTYKAIVAVFSRDLAACPGSGTTCSTTYRTRPPGKIFTQLMGNAPNRFYVVQWNDWDHYSTTSAGSLTFEAKIYESGIVEVQYKTLQSASSTAFTTTPPYIGVQNTAGTQGFNVSTRPLKDGDGWRFDTNAGTPQLPYDFVPFDFVDVSQSGTQQTLTTTGAPTGTANFDTGYATVTFPDGFAPIYLGETMTSAAISADGVVTLSSSASYSCTSGCTSVGALPSTTYKAVVAAFNADLSACAGATNAAGCTARGRAPGKVYTQLVGTAPRRTFVVQWSDWDFKSATSAGSLTFELKISENGDTEIQYKNMQSLNATAAQGSGANIGLQNTAGTTGLTLSTGTSTQWRPLGAGDGFHFYSGNQAPTGSVRTFFTLPSTATKLTYRGTAINALAPGGVTDTKSVPLLAGVNDVVINELMVNPVDGADDDKEWIELRNLTTSPVSLKGYTLQTSSGSYTFTGGQIPAKTATNGDGFLVVGMSADTSKNGGVPVAIAYGNQMQMNDVADSVILRYGNILIDRVEYDTGAGWTAFRGQSMSYDGSMTTAAGNDLPTGWCGGSIAGNATAKASPGAANGQCYTLVPIAYNSAYDLEAITPALTAVQVEGDEAYVNSLPIGFAFPHFGIAYTTVSVSTNGWLSFGTASSAGLTNTALPSTLSSHLDALFPYWDDLTYITSRTVNGATKKSSIYTATLGTAPNRKFVVHWAGYRTYANSASVTDFMAVLGEDGGIEFHYKALSSADGSGATIGLQALTNTYGIQYGYNQAVLPPAGASVPFGLRLTSVR